MPSSSTAIHYDAVVELDRADPLAATRELFVLPEGVRYFDGNSLGPLPRSSRKRVAEVVQQEWGQDLIRSWNLHRWIDLPRRLGARVSRLIGATPDEVVIADSTSINLFKLLSAALDLRPSRRVIVSESSQFPTDLYMAEGLASLRRDSAGSGPELRLVEPRDLVDAIDHDVAVACLSHVDFKSGKRRDMAELTRIAHQRGALILWDLSHSAGAMEIDLDGCDVDLAVGCTYKFLNGGPGAPAYLFVARRHLSRARSPLWGWFGHRDPFAFETSYQPAPGIDRFQCGTPPILNLAALDGALDVFDEVDLSVVRRKSLALGDLFLDLVRQDCAGLGLSSLSPEGKRRGSHVALRHEQGYRIIQALIERGVIGDFRAPDVLRFGLAPLYLRYVDIWHAVRALRDVLETRSWADPRFEQKGKVT